MTTSDNAATAGFSMGTALAMMLSFQLNHSIVWAIAHRHLLLVLCDLGFM